MFSIYKLSTRVRCSTAQADPHSPLALARACNRALPTLPTASVAYAAHGSESCTSTRCVRVVFQKELRAAPI